MQGSSNINSTPDRRKPSTNGSEDSKFVTALRKAIANDELLIHYQPRYNISSCRTTIVEALVRWQKEGKSILLPENFLQKAIDTGLIYELDLWVFEQCCKDLPILQNKLDEKVKIAVNITPIECTSLYHSQKIIDICRSYELSLSDFEFEITENSRMDNIQRIQSFCNTFIELGASFSLDDFGTCYSPLQSLCELPASYIKLDKCFIEKLDDTHRNRILVTHLIQLAHEMEIKVVAEGIETKKQKETLIEMGCDQLQGYFLCRPLNLHSISLVNTAMYNT